MLLCLNILLSLRKLLRLSKLLSSRGALHAAILRQRLLQGQATVVKGVLLALYWLLLLLLWLLWLLLL